MSKLNSTGLAKTFWVAAMMMTLSSWMAFGQEKPAAPAAPALQIVQVEPTPLFPKAAAGQPPKQLVRLHVDNPGAPFEGTVRIALAGKAPETQPVQIGTGKSAVAIQIPDIAAPTPVTVELLAKDGTGLAAKKLDWQPQKKWTFYCCSYSHQDLGFGDYPHRLRTSIRHENIKLPLQFCRETDAWPKDDQYRFNIETSEPLTSFISFNGKDAARELAARMKEGRIQLLGLHNTANTEELSHELMARLFYMTGRHAVDLLGVPAGKTFQQTDVIGQTWPLATYAKEAGFDYCFHGFNRICMPNIENGRTSCDFNFLDSERGIHTFSVGNEPNFFWQGPDGQQMLRRATTYERHDLLDNPYEKNPSPVQRPDRIEMLIRAHEKMNWPFSAILSQDGGDFILVRRTIADRARKWNAEYAWPHIRFATFDDYFHAIEQELAEKKIALKTIAGDENNQWSDQDYTVAKTSGRARRLSEALPAVESLATFAQVVAGGGDQWINLFQGYHRLLAYNEHTNAKDSANGNMTWYETELEENREMVTEAESYRDQVFASATRRLNGVIARNGEKNLVVFNAQPHRRTDSVRVDLQKNEIVVEQTTGGKPAVQHLPDGSAMFLAHDVPATGYRVYRIETAAAEKTESASGPILDTPFYKMAYDPATGAITSLFDKELAVELIDPAAPHQANQYLYVARGQWTTMLKADSITVERGPVADILTVTGKAGGVTSLKQSVIIHRGIKQIDFTLWVDKAPYKPEEAVFIAFPFKVQDFRIRHELPGCVAEPYRQQVEGSATDHYAVRSFTDLYNEKYGVTVSPVECSLVCYGKPQIAPGSVNGHFNRSLDYPKNSWLYLYLMNNMFTVNTALDQRGPVSFTWSLRSHAGDWQAGNAASFGRGVQQPLIAWRADGKNRGALPASASFMNVNAPNIMCSVIKPAEMNGRGLIIRLNETTGKETAATVSLPMLPAIESVTETSLVENDRGEKIARNGNAFTVQLPKFGVKTYRVTYANSAMAVTDAKAKPVADMQVDLSWKAAGKAISHFNIYRDTDPACPATMLNFIGQSATAAFSDRPQVNSGGWLRSCLALKTAYFYRVVPVDRANNPGAPSALLAVTTPGSAQANLPPVAVEGLRAILVSSLTRDNFANLLFRTACEPDVVQYEIHRGAQPGFTAGKTTLVGTVNSGDIPPRSGGYGESQTQHKVREYDHAIFADRTAPADAASHYKVRAIDAAGQPGAFSAEVTFQPKVTVPLRGCTVAAQSTYAPEYDAALALDGDPDPFQAWISKPYGGGTKTAPQEVWWSVEFEKPTRPMAGVKIIGDHRDVIPLQTALQVQVRENGAWKTVAEMKDAKEKDIAVTFPKALPVSGLRIVVPAADLPKSPARADTDGIVRICEIEFVYADGK
jgi:hypothetical protein